MTSLHVSIYAIIRHVGEPTCEPSVKRCLRIIEDSVPRLEPFDVSHLLSPEGLPGVGIEGPSPVLFIGLLRNASFDNEGS